VSYNRAVAGGEGARAGVASSVWSSAAAGEQREVWRQAEEWAAAADLGKRGMLRARGAAFVLGTVGAALGALGGSTLAGAPTAARLLGLGSAVAVVLAGFIGREFLGESQELAWSRARILAEALRREVWLSLMRVPPYDGFEAADTILQTAERLQQNTGLHRTARAHWEPAPFPEATTLTDYARLRLDGQIAYYGISWRRADRRTRRWRAAAALLAGAATVLGLGVVTSPTLPAWVPVLTTAAAATAAHLRALRLEAVLPLFQEAEHQLRLKRAAFDGGHVTQRAAFVHACEDIMSRENQSWRAEWKRPLADATAGADAEEETRPPTKSPPIGA